MITVLTFLFLVGLVLLLAQLIRTRPRDEGAVVLTPVPIFTPPADTDPIEAKLQVILHQLDLTRHDIQATRNSVIYRSRSWRQLLYGFLLVTAVAGFAQFTSIRNIAEIERGRDESRIGSCRQDNIRIIQHNDLVAATEAVRTAAMTNASSVTTVQAEIDTVMAAVTQPRPDETPEQAAARETFRALADKLKAPVDQSLAEGKTALTSAGGLLAGTRVPERDCSLAGVERYLQGG